MIKLGLFQECKDYSIYANQSLSACVYTRFAKVTGSEVVTSDDQFVTPQPPTEGGSSQPQGPV